MDARVGRVNLAALCRVYGISRQTGCKWVRRFCTGQAGDIAWWGPARTGRCQRGVAAASGRAAGDEVDGAARVAVLAGGALLEAGLPAPRRDDRRELAGGEEAVGRVVGAGSSGPPT